MYDIKNKIFKINKNIILMYFFKKNLNRNYYYLQKKKKTFLLKSLIKDKDNHLIFSPANGLLNIS